jgi:hypothetical protein
VGGCPGQTNAGQLQKLSYTVQRLHLNKLNLRIAASAAAAAFAAILQGQALGDGACRVWLPHKGWCEQSAAVHWGVFNEPGEANNRGNNLCRAATFASWLFRRVYWIARRICDRYKL